MSPNVKLIVEIGINHMGDFDLMAKMMSVAHSLGVQYIKGQKREPRVCLTEEQYNRPYDGPQSFGKTYGEHKEALEFDVDQWRKLFNIAGHHNYCLFSSVFDVVSANNMNNLGQKIFKIGSAEVSKLELLELVATFNKPVIMSTGMHNIDEIDRAVDILQPKVPELILMHTTSCYPCHDKDLNLRIIPELKKRYGTEVGFSGHHKSGNGAIEAAAIALGATWIERHFTLDRTWKGSDQAASLEPVGLINVIKAIESTTLALGSNKKEIQKCELPVRKKLLCS